MNGPRPTFFRRATVGTGRFTGRLFLTLVRIAIVVAIVAGSLLIGGLARFAHDVRMTRAPLDIPAAEAIVVLTGGSERIAAGLELLATGKSTRKKLLISGVNETTSPRAIAALNNTRRVWFDCCVELDRAATNTLGNARESARWVKENEFKSIILVTSAYHMPRSLIEFRRALPDRKVLPYDVSYEPLLAENWWRKPSNVRLLVGEYLKYLGSMSRDYLDAKTLDAVRSTVFGS